MKKSLFCLVLLLVLLVLATGTGLAADIPRRSATSVSDVFEPYTADDWIVSPDEEPEGDQNVSNAPECDVKGIIACYDKTYLRVDFLLYSSVTFKKQVLYSVRFEYDTMIEYYTYYPLSKEMVYEKEVNGKITVHKVLDTTKSDDQAGVTSSGDMKNNNVYLIINKDKHIGGDKGKTYYLTTSFYAGFIDTKNKLQVADETIDVDLLFVK